LLTCCEGLRCCYVTGEVLINRLGALVLDFVSEVFGFELPCQAGMLPTIAFGILGPSFIDSVGVLEYRTCH
jgi:hypothetical protein